MKSIIFNIFLILLFGCYESSSLRNKSNEQDFLIDTGISISYIDSSNNAEPKDTLVSTFSIDEKYKAFNDIYFTTKDKSSFNKSQELLDRSFTVSGEKFESDFGLYEFILVNGGLNNFSIVNQVLNNLYKLFDQKNFESKTLSSIENSSTFTECNSYRVKLGSLFSGENLDPLPDDDNNAYFTRLYYNSDKEISIGYSICYDYGTKTELKTFLGPNGPYQVPVDAGLDKNVIYKKYNVFLRFRSIEIFERVNENNKARESKKREEDASKF